MASSSKIRLSPYQVRQQGHRYWTQLRQALFPPESADYVKWRHEFLHKRLGFGLWIGLICFLISAGHGLYIFVVKIETIRSDVEKIYGQSQLAEQWRDITIVGFFLITGLLLCCLLLQKTCWGKHYSVVVFLLFACSVNGFVTQIISTFYSTPVEPSTIVFLAFAVLLPLRWPLHLLSQLLPIGYYTVVYPLLGITEVGNVSIFSSVYSASTFIEIGWVCLICNTGVYVYERLRRSEFESRRELQIFLHAISHDLRSPVTGTSIVVQNLLQKATDDQVEVSTDVLNRLLQGSDRQLALINALVEAYHADGQKMLLHRQPLQLSTVVATALADIEPKLIQNNVDLHTSISSALPLVSADPTHLWRVFSNLIDNALKHNPSGIQLTLRADIVVDSGCSILGTNQPVPAKQSKANLNLNRTSMLCCYVKDNGIGIPAEQCQRLFELYTRGKRARYMPGLGLGLYLCKQIITAHGGEIGVVSEVDKGTTFWFTLPLATSFSSYE
ncbi:HAMP domain-containing histidine kinase [Nodosilinea sp. LEGE 07088]|uniref:sensor histidine kinase n=1 Tax=Nodosilinea sp. LEGE 07088 TaxID=2777968 RepID=UPI00188095BF|nr:HAMP domain-containing sensor histidine kinase [Nodosilinea sp. LEGE 07088]MBE9140819.1 HAMP domain-containing histidine kinase [Nodosilinea sp. LEGE 07088]